MKKQKISLSLRKQKISSLSGKQINGGNLVNTIVIKPIETLVVRDCVVVRITQQTNCESLFVACPTDTITMPSFCCPTTQPSSYVC